ncbi:tetratricopeptide repeat protein [Pseudoxanthomonas sp. JBR18]|uniref:heme biosynthesis protein HemY n=1 Tax=Pseudoxanthomonas sp. JBR18 TaxID=2969308 RepID=UPI0023059C03|nr:tetratricopeptide repeat protein [Pseudoxanthomonas sp. JBR18]WCE05752.1 tetratricopeptide repeat protein [Pseudoxanthomonas sp. JBR18]
MSLRTPKHALLSLAVIGLLAGTVAVDASAQTRERAERSKKGGDSKQEEMYPNATRKAPEAKNSRKMASKASKMIDAYNDQDWAKARTDADEIIANSDSNDYDKALAAQIASQAAYNTDDEAATKAYLKQAIDLNALDNNGHYQAMYMLAQLQLQDEQYQEGLATLDKYMTETQSTKPEDLALKGQALYQAERYAEAIPPMKQAIESSPEPKAQWVQVLMASYDANNQSGEALKLAEQLAAKSPDDKNAQMNLAVMYSQNDQPDKAAAILDKLRTSGKLTDPKEYRQLYATYSNMDGHEKDTIAVINDGLSKGVLQPNLEVYQILAQSYYYSDQPAQAIDAWQKAAPLDSTGETYLNLARVLMQENRPAEAKKAAQSALDKGVKKPQDAKAIISAK